MVFQVKSVGNGRERVRVTERERMFDERVSSREERDTEIVTEMNNKTNGLYIEIGGNGRDNKVDGGGNR